MERVKEDKGTESDMVINENIVEPIRLVDNKEAMDEEEATRWEKYEDNLPKIPSSLHNDIMEAGGKDRPPMLALGNYIQWKSRIKRYIDTKLNHELIHYCLKHAPYKFKWAERTIPVAKARAVHIILTGIDNDIYSTVDACPNAMEIWKAIERLKQDDALSKEKEIDKLMALISLSFKKIYKPTNNNLKTLSNTSKANQDNTPRINRGTRYDNPRAVNVAGARENVEEAKIQLSAEQVDWRDDTDDEPID
ncbi:hypothetical protein Tco_1578716 [Tanacetum coccineum]